MIEVLQFIFRGFWTWLGTAILLSIVFGSLSSLFRTVVVYVKDRLK